MSAGMNALAVRPEAGVPAPAAPPATTAPDGRFADLLGAMGRPSPSAGSAAQADRKPPEDTETLDAAAPSALQSLAATLNGFLRKPAPAPPQPSGPAVAAAPLNAALNAAAGALGGGLGGPFDVSGQTPLKTQLQGDPSLGLQTFQIKTYLAAAGATPMRAGATALGAESAWSPLGAANAPRPAAPAAGATRPSVVSRGANSPLNPAAASAPPGAAPVGTIGSSPRRRDGDAPAAAPQAPAPATAATADAANAPTLSMPLAELPAFIADQANAMTSAAAEPAAPATAVATPKAAQAVKELQISLDPGELGEMTLKLRLAGGKLSVTIAVANPRTLSAIEDDRALIAARLGDAGQALGDLVIQRQSPSLTETVSAHAPPNDNGASTADRERPSSQERPDPPPRGGAGAGGDPGDFLV